MLNLHLPYRSPRSWKEFLFRIATIVIGLLLTVGFQQAAGLAHRRRETGIAREALREERTRNLRSFAINTEAFRDQAVALRNNYLVLSYLKQHPGASEAKLPGVLAWGGPRAPARQSAWKTLQQTGATALFSNGEMIDSEALYKYLDSVDAAAVEVWRAVTRAGAYRLIDPDISHLTPGCVSAELDLTRDAIEANFRWGIALHDLHRDYPEFTPAPATEELAALEFPGRDDNNNARLGVPRSLTYARRAKTIAALQMAMKEEEMMNSKKSALFTQVYLGAIRLKHRIVMAPLTRSRSLQPNSVPGDLMAEYYRQRASYGGLIISEATNISIVSRGWFGAPGLYYRLPDLFSASIA